MKELQEKLKKYKKWNDNLNLFLEEQGFKKEKDLLCFIKEYKNHKCSSIDKFNIKDSEYFNKLKNIEHDINIHKYDLLLINTNIYNYNKIKKESTKKINEIKEYKLSEIYNNFSNILTEIENEYNEWCKIPKCFHCDIKFDNYNHSYSIKKYDLSDLCFKCINDELNNIISEQKFIKEIDNKYKDNKVVNKLLSKKYHNLILYNEIYIDSQNDQISLYDSDIIRYAGFDPNNPYDKYKLNNLCYRANKLIELFGDKIKFINIPESDLERMGKMEFQAICNILYEKVGGYAGCEHIMDILNIDNNETKSDNEEYISDDEEYISDDEEYIPFSPDEEYISDDEDSMPELIDKISAKPKKTYVLRFS
jgi:hypothetical protein